MRTVSFKLSRRLDDSLSAMARRRNASRSALIREALEALAKAKHRSVTEVVDGLVEALDGPADLSTGPKYITGYGR